MNTKLRNQTIDMFDPDLSAKITATGQETLRNLKAKIAAIPQNPQLAAYVQVVNDMHEAAAFQTRRSAFIPFVPLMTTKAFGTTDMYSLLKREPSMAIHPDHYREDDPWWPPEVCVKTVIGTL